MEKVSEKVGEYKDKAVKYSLSSFEGMLKPMFKVIYSFKQLPSIWELLLNILFVVLIVIFLLIIYWDTINRKVSKTSRCKKQLDIYNKNKGVYIINATDKNKDPLFNITYDINQNNTNIECACKAGNLVNYFNEIPIKDTRSNRDNKIDKICSCDKFYNTGMISENIVYSGEPGILRYMNANDSTFFDNLAYAGYN